MLGRRRKMLIQFCMYFIFGIFLRLCYLFSRGGSHSNYNVMQSDDVFFANKSKKLSSSDLRELRPFGHMTIETNTAPSTVNNVSRMTPTSASSIATESFRSRQNGMSNRAYSIKLPGCKIVNYKPFDDDVKPFYEEIPKLKCGNSFAFASGNELYIDKEGMSKYFDIPKDNISCTLESINRVGGRSDDQFKMKTLTELFSRNYTSTHEFLKLTCIALIDGRRHIYDDMFAFIQKKEEVEKRCKTAAKKRKTKVKQKEMFSIVFVGLGSVSHLNFLRQFPSTYRYIQQNFKPLEYHGYTKLGSDTFSCLLPLLTGKTHHELKLARGPYDNEPFIWKKFSQLGYRTQFAEDWTSEATFNYMKEGFRTQPTDYYLRPFYLAAGNTFMIYESEHCFHSREEISVLLQWVKDFLDAFKRDPLFSFSFSATASYYELNDAGVLDGSMTNFFRWFKTHPKRNDTFLILFSDHGLRSGNFRSTVMGSQEDRLPLFLMFVPPLFSKNYPGHYRNLKQNQLRLMTLFDVHEMLKDLMNFTGFRHSVKPSVSQRGISLFNEIPNNRMCDDAGISQQFCVCGNRDYVAVNRSLCEFASKKLMKVINSLSTPRCANLKLESIRSCIRYEITRRSKQNKITKLHRLILLVETHPGQGLFEGTVLCKITNNSDCTAEHYVESISSYHVNADCIQDDSKMREYCYCS